MKEELIKQIAKLGGSRWIKGNYDRMYFDDETLGYDIDYYKTGFISSARIVEWEPIDDETIDMSVVNSITGKISNNKARGFAGGKRYIDLKTDEISAGEMSGERIRYLIKKAEKALEEEKAKPVEILTSKKAKKLTVEEAIEALSMTTTTEQIAMVFDRCKATTLQILAKATEKEMDVKVRGRCKRAELLEILSTHSDWILRYDSERIKYILDSRIKHCELIKAIRKTKDIREWQNYWNQVEHIIDYEGHKIDVTDLIQRALKASRKQLVFEGLNKVCTIRAQWYTEKMTRKAMIEDYLLFISLPYYSSERLAMANGSPVEGSKEAKAA